MRLILCAITCLFFGQISVAGTLILSGDTNILVATDAGNANFNANNQTFMSNVLGTGTSVYISQEANSGGFNVDAYFDTLPGVTSTFQFGNTKITDTLLGGIDLYIMVNAADPFLNSEWKAIANFVNSGGTLFVAAENNPSIGAVSTHVNDLLSKLGSGMVLVDKSLDVAYRTTTNYISDPFTAGLTNLTYAGPKRVTGGTALVDSRDGSFFEKGTFIAVERDFTATLPPVPLPASVLLLLGALAGLGGLKRKRRG